MKKKIIAAGLVFILFSPFLGLIGYQAEKPILVVCAVALALMGGGFIYDAVVPRKEDDV